MEPLFLDPHRQLHGCSPKRCEECPVNGRLHCHFKERDIWRFFAFACPVMILGGIGIVHGRSWLWLLPWVALAFVFFSFIEVRVLCSHCPHYGEPRTKKLQCWVNYGSPKLWKYRPGPMSIIEKSIFFLGIALVAGYPLAFLVIGAQWLLLALFVVAGVVMFVLMNRFMCAHCINFACPLNHVDTNVRNTFFAVNPLVGKAWQKK